MITLIAAMDENRVIGNDNTIPWYLPNDFKHFKQTTLNHPIIMGRKTYESLPRRPLPNRTNIVVSRSSECLSDITVVPTILDAIRTGLRENPDIFVIGGQSIYEQTINWADRLLITHVHGTHEGNYHFPEISPTKWQPTLLSRGTGFDIFQYHLKNNY